MNDWKSQLAELYKGYSTKQKNTKGELNKFDKQENFKGKKGIGLDLQAVQVMDLVEYTPREEFDVETGNTSGSGVDNIKEF